MNAWKLNLTREQTIICRRVASVSSILSTIIVLWCAKEHYLTILPEVAKTGTVTIKQVGIITIFNILAKIFFPTMLIGNILIWILSFTLAGQEDTDNNNALIVVGTITPVIFIFCFMYLVSQSPAGSSIIDAKITYHRQNFLKPLVGTITTSSYCSPGRLLKRKRIVHLFCPQHPQIYQGNINAYACSIDKSMLGELYFNRNEIMDKHSWFDLSAFEDSSSYNRTLPQEAPMGAILEWRTEHPSGRQIALDKGSVPEIILRANIMVIDIDNHCIIGEAYRDGSRATRPERVYGTGATIHVYSSIEGSPPNQEDVKSAIQSFLEPVNK